MPQLQVLQPCDARAVEVVELADAIGVEIVRKLAHGEGAGAYEVRVGDGMPAVLKVDADDVLDFGHSIKFTEALRVRGYPVPASLASGEVDGTGYELAERMPGDPVEQITAAHVPQLVALVGMQRDIGLPGRAPWVGDMVASLTDGFVGYCQLDTLRAHNPALLARLQEVAARSRGLDVASRDTVHYDFSPYNVLAEGDRITGVVDWQGATSGDAAFDLVTLAYYTYDFALRDRVLDAARAITCPAALRLYAAHMVLRQVDWSLRHQDEAAVWWSTGMGEALLDVLDA
jgi:phosphotransferase family enzyme